MEPAIGLLEAPQKAPLEIEVKENSDFQIYAGELRRCAFGKLLLAASRFRRLRRLCLSAAIKLERGMVYSLTARQIMHSRYGVRIGAYSYGGCFEPGSIPSGVVIGRYVSIAPGVKIFRRDRFLNWLSLHPFFFNPLFGYVEADPIASVPLVIEHDAWIGERVLITPGCTRIGLGSVVGAGAVVTKDVPDFAIVVGNPARLVRYRFPSEMCDVIRGSKWWLAPKEQLTRGLSEMTRPLEGSDFLRELEATIKNRAHETR